MKSGWHGNRSTHPGGSSRVSHETESRLALVLAEAPFDASRGGTKAKRVRVAALGGESHSRDGQRLSRKRKIELCRGAPGACGATSNPSGVGCVLGAEETPSPSLTRRVARRPPDARIGASRRVPPHRQGASEVRVRRSRLLQPHRRGGSAQVAHASEPRIHRHGLVGVPSASSSTRAEARKANNFAIRFRTKPARIGGFGSASTFNHRAAAAAQARLRRLATG